MFPVDGTRPQEAGVQSQWRVGTARGGKDGAPGGTPSADDVASMFLAVWFVERMVQGRHQKSQRS